MEGKWVGGLAGCAWWVWLNSGLVGMVMVSWLIGWENYFVVCQKARKYTSRDLMGYGLVGWWVD